MKTHLLSLSLLMVTSLYGMKEKDHVISSIMNTDLTEVVKRHQKELKVSDIEAARHERELKRFLAIAALNPKEEIGMFSEPVDNMWHNFILFTAQYAAFCYKHAGSFLHHEPTTGEQDRAEALKQARSFVAHYVALFKEQPPADLWPHADPDITSNCKILKQPCKDLTICVCGGYSLPTCNTAEALFLEDCTALKYAKLGSFLL